MPPRTPKSPPPLNRYYDTVVLGLGGVGTFALRALARAAKEGNGGSRNGQQGRILGIEKFALNHNRGSSHGRTRVFRRAYFEHPSYVPWIEHSVGVFRELERSHDVSLLKECGMLTVAPEREEAGSSSTSSLLPPLLEATQRSAEMHGIPTVLLTHEELIARYPQFNLREEEGSIVGRRMAGLFEGPEGAGFVRPERALEAAQRDFVRETSAVDVLEHTEVKQIVAASDDDKDGGSVVLRILKHNDGSSDGDNCDNSGDELSSTEEEIIVAKTLLISAGAWTSQLVPAWAPYLKATRQLQGWIDVGDDGGNSYSPDNLPAWFLSSPKWPIPIYGIPYDPDDCDADRRRWIKIASHGRDCPLDDPSGNSRRRATESEIAELQRIAGIAFARYSENVEIADVEPCMYTMTPDQHFIIGSPSPNVFAVAGLSGHGFKMTPALGQMMADFALGRDTTRWNFGFCSPDRFTS